MSEKKAGRRGCPALLPESWQAGVRCMEPKETKKEWETEEEILSRYKEEQNYGEIAEK